MKPRRSREISAFARTIPYAALLAVLLTAGPVHAQGVRGAVVEERTGQPVVGAFVVLVDGTGRERLAALTDEQGGYVLDAPEPGPYRVRIDRIGYRSTVSPELDLWDGHLLDFDVTVRVEPVQLEAINLSPIDPATERVCDLPPTEAERISEVWEEARKALSATVWTQGGERYRLTVRRYERRLDGEGRGDGDERSEVWIGVNRTSPFVSLPPEELVERGYVRLETDGARYFAPDAEVLLSKEFAESHCFRLRAADEEHAGMIGLEFDPEEVRGFVDVEGALWIEEQSAELKSLEYRYTGVSEEVGEDEAGGQVVFERLPSGAWIVSDWEVRVPAIRREPEMRWQRVSGGFLSSPSSRMRDTVLAIHETGGSVEQIHTLDGMLLRGRETAAVTGAVRDSVREEPLRGARVTLERTAYRALSDSLGRFRFGAIPGGRYTVVVQHPRLDSLGVAPLRREIVAEAGTSKRVELATPSTITLLAAACEEDQVAVVGTVRDGTSGAPLAAGRVDLAWRADDAVHRREATADGAGRYVLCDVPVGRTLVARAQFPGRAARAVFAVPTGRYVLRHDFDLQASRLESAVALEARGRGTTSIGGWIVDDATGAPVEGAQISLAGTGRGVVADPAGRFLIGGIEPGAHVVEIERLGYGDARASVEVDEGESVSLAVRMVGQPIAAEPLEATAGEAGRSEGYTVYRLDAEDIEGYPVMGLVDLLALTIPGVEVGFDETFGCMVPLLRATPGGGSGLVRGPAPLASRNHSASPLVVLEGMPLSSPCELAMLNPSDVERLEIVSSMGATGRYGWRGANGVILVEIKSRIRRPGEAREEKPEEEAKTDERPRPPTHVQ